MEAEPMKNLRQKLIELKKHRDTFKREEDLEKRSMSQIEDEIKSLEMMFQKKTRHIEENEVKLARYDEVLRHSQDALGKLAETTKKLEGVVGNELASLKS